MAYSEHLADRVRQRLQNSPVTGEIKMMGGLAFMVNHKMCIGILTNKETEEDQLMVKVGNEEYEQLLQKKEAREMDFTGKAMKGFLFVDAEGIDSEEGLDFWINKALEFNRKAH